MKYLLALLLTSCVGTLPDGANTPATIGPATTRAHCVALDVESDLMPPMGAAFTATGLGLAAFETGQDKPSLTVKATALALGGVGAFATGWGMLASKSWYTQCQAQPKPDPIPPSQPAPIPEPAPKPVPAATTPSPVAPSPQVPK